MLWGALLTLSHLILTSEGDHCYPCFIDEDTEFQRGSGNLSGLPSGHMAQMGMVASQAGTRAHLFNLHSFWAFLSRFLSHLVLFTKTLWIKSAIQI